MMPKTETSALRAHQLALLQMLHEIDRVCKKHHICKSNKKTIKSRISRIKYVSLHRFSLL